MLLPEVPFDIEKDVGRSNYGKPFEGKFHYLIVVAEGVGDTTKIANTTREMIKEKHNIDIETKVCILGHIQRGGKPTVKDRGRCQSNGRSCCRAATYGNRKTVWLPCNIIKWLTLIS